MITAHVLLPLVLGASILEPNLDLRLRQTQVTRQLFALAANNVAILFENLLQPQQLPGRESCSYAFRFAEHVR